MKLELTRLEDRCTPAVITTAGDTIYKNGLPLNTPFPGLAVNAGLAPDVNQDGYPEIIAGPGVGGGPRAVLIDGRTNATLLSWFPEGMDPQSRLGLRVAGVGGTPDCLFFGIGPGGPDFISIYGAYDLGVRYVGPGNPDVRTNEDTLFSTVPTAYTYGSGHIMIHVNTDPLKVYETRYVLTTAWALLSWAGSQITLTTQPLPANYPYTAEAYFGIPQSTFAAKNIPNAVGYANFQFAVQGLPVTRTYRGELGIKAGLYVGSMPWAIAHEVGHLMGGGHSPNRSSVLYEFLIVGNTYPADERGPLLASAASYE